MKQYLLLGSKVLTTTGISFIKPEVLMKKYSLRPQDVILIKDVAENNLSSFTKINLAGIDLTKLKVVFPVSSEYGIDELNTLTESVISTMKASTEVMIKALKDNFSEANNDWMESKLSKGALRYMADRLEYFIVASQILHDNSSNPDELKSATNVDGELVLDAILQLYAECGIDLLYCYKHNLSHEFQYAFTAWNEFMMVNGYYNLDKFVNGRYIKIGS